MRGSQLNSSMLSTLPAGLHYRSSLIQSRKNSHNRHVSSTATAAVVEPAQLAAIAAEPVVEVAVLAGVGALCAKQGLLPLQGR